MSDLCTVVGELGEILQSIRFVHSRRRDQKALFDDRTVVGGIKKHCLTIAQSSAGVEKKKYFLSTRFVHSRRQIIKIFSEYEIRAQSSAKCENVF